MKIVKRTADLRCVQQQLPLGLRVLFSPAFRIAVALGAGLAVTLYFVLAHSPGLCGRLAVGIGDQLRAHLGTRGRVEKIQTVLPKLMLLIGAVGAVGTGFIEAWMRLLRRYNTVAVGAIKYHDSGPRGVSDYSLVAAITLLAGLLRAVGLGQSLWLDELGQYKVFVRPGIMATLLPSSSLGSHPLMQIVVGLFTDFAGVSEVTLRLPIFLAAVVTVPVLYGAVLKVTGDRLAAVLSALFLTINSYHVYYSFQMKGYAILALLCLMYTWLSVDLIIKPGRRTDLMLAGTGVLIVYTHLYAIYFLLAQNLLVLALTVWGKGHGQGIISRQAMIEYLNSFVLSAGALALLYAPYIPVTLFNLFGAGKPASLDIVEALSLLVAYSAQPWLGALYLAVVLALFLRYREAAPSWLMVGQGLSFLLLMLALPSGGTGFRARYLFCALPHVVIMLSLVVSGLLRSEERSSRLLATLLTGIYVALSFGGLLECYKPIQDYRGAILYVRSRAAPESVVVANSLGKDLVQFYDSRIVPLSEPAQLLRVMSSCPEVWALTSYEDLAGSEFFPEDKETQEIIQRQFQLVRTFPGEPVRVWRYSRNGGEGTPGR